MKHLHAIKTDPEKGFNLLEITIVLFIVGILAAISAPNLLGWYNRNKLNNAVMEIKGGLQQAQRQAMRQSIDCSVTFDAAEDIMKDGDTSGANKGCLLSKRDLDNAIDMTLKDGSTEKDISFDLRGNINFTDNTTILITTDSVPSTECIVISGPLGIIRTGNFQSGSCNKK